jgi:hypothetical protein
MTQLKLEPLDARELMSATVLTATAPIAPQVSGYSIVQTYPATEYNVVDLTAPLGSDKGSFAGDGFGAVP